MDISYKVTTAKFDDIFLHLEKCKNNFIPPLDQRVNIREYAEKIFEKAIRFEAWSQSSLVGLLAAYFNKTDGHKGYVTNVSVMPEYGGQGIASRLMADCVAYSYEHGYEELDLEVNADNMPAIGLYKKFGFAEYGKKDRLILMKLGTGGRI